MKQYINMLEYIMANGDDREDRTGTGTISVFGYQERYDLRKGFPLMTTKDVSFRLMYEELKWFLKGETNIKPLVDKNVNIWNKDAYRWHKEKNPKSTLTFKEFIQAIKDGDWELGELGDIYGKQWTAWGEGDTTINQIEQVIEAIKENPYSRRHLVTAWNPTFLDDMALPPCHVMFQFYVNSNRELSCQLYQRSADVFLGVPFNIASYALLTHMIADLCGLSVGEFIHTTGDTHLYKNHIDKAMIQISRTPHELPQLAIRRDFMRKGILDYDLEDFKLTGYNPYEKIAADVSVGL